MKIWGWAMVLGALAGCRGWNDGADVVLSTDGEIRTPAAALMRVRELRTAGAIAPDRMAVVAVKGGRYRLSAPVVFGSEDSRVQFVGPQTGEAVFDGGVELPRFVARADGVWETPVAAGFDFDQLWINGRRAQRARTPNRHFLYMAGEDFELPGRAFFAETNDVAALAKLPADELARVVGVFWQSWDMGYSFAESVDGATGRMVFRNPMGRILFFWDMTRPRYALENYRAALDAPGEWFLDFKAAKLLYLPLPGETPDGVRAVAPRTEGLVRIAGDGAKERRVCGVEFRNISFEHAGWRLTAAGAPNRQSAQNIRQAAVFATDAEGIVLENCRVAHTGAHGVWLERNCHRSRIVHSLIEDLGGGGVYFGDTAKDLVRRDLNASGLSLTDSIVRRGGRVFNGAIGVWLGHVHDCEVVHNEIADWLYSGVSMGWTWGYAETVNRNNHIDFNHIHHIGQGRLSDMGGVYTLGDNTGSTVCNNWIHDVNGYADNGSPAWGLYTDEGSRGILLASNLVERCRDGAVHQHYGRENVYANNIFATFDKFGVWRSRTEDHVTIRVLDNIFWWTNPEAGAYTGAGPVGAQENLPADGNVYWCAGGTVLSNAFKKASWADWRAKGADAKGAVSDPLFADPANGDWTLRPDSPALKAGFRPFDWRRAGVLKNDPDWVCKAAETTWDPFEDAPKAERFRRQRFASGFETLKVGPVPDKWGVMTPFVLSQGKPGAIAVVDDDVRAGRRALRFVDSPTLPQAFQPHLYMKCGKDAGEMTIRFAYRGDEKSRMLLETRDYNVEGAPYATGHAVNVKDGKVTAGGRFVCELKPGAWADFELRISLEGPGRGAWTCSVTPVGGERKSVDVPRPQHPQFRSLDWIGFISPGTAESSWWLDAFSFE